MVPGHEVAGRAGSRDRLHLSREVQLGGPPARLIWSGESSGVGVVAKKDHDPLPALGGKLAAQCHQRRLAGGVGCTGIADQIEACLDEFLREGRNWRWGWWRGGTGGDADQRGQATGTGSRIHRITAVACSACDLRWYSRPTATARTSQTEASTRFTRAKPVVPNPSRVTPT